MVEIVIYFTYITIFVEQQASAGPLKAGFTGKTKKENDPRWLIALTHGSPAPSSIACYIIQLYNDGRRPEPG
jgi:hypothetical protein